jgi:cell division septum initiation protein DivIVA
MTKLEELEAAWKSAHAAVRAAQADYDAADGDCMAALEAYEAELKKQEENE